MIEAAPKWRRFARLVHSIMDLAFFSLGKWKQEKQCIDSEYELIALPWISELLHRDL